MINQAQMKLKLVGIGILILITISIIGIALFNTFIPSQSTTPNSNATPTPVPTSPTPSDPQTYQFTPLQISSIGKTTDEQITQQNIILSKRTVGDTTIYSVRSKEPGKTDEIRTTGGVVIFEKTSTKTNAAPLPKLASIESQYGEPEETLDKVGEGFYMSAYLYPERGFAIYANKYTGSVYEIQRFLPMTLAEYKKQYGQTLSPAPAMPKEFQDL